MWLSLYLNKGFSDPKVDRDPLVEKQWSSVPTVIKAGSRLLVFRCKTLFVNSNIFYSATSKKSSFEIKTAFSLAFYLDRQKWRHIFILRVV